MALPTNLDQRERTKFRDISGSVAVAVVNSDGSAIGTGGGSTTVFQGGAPWSVELSSMATVTLGTGLNQIDDTISIGDPVISGLKWNLTSLATGNPGMVALMDRQGHVADVDISGALRTYQASSATIYAITTGGGTTTVFQGGAPWSVNVASIATLYAVTTGGAVNATVFQGGAPWTALVTNLNQLPLVAGTSSIGLATVHQGGAPWSALATVAINPTPILGAGLTTSLFVSTATGSMINSSLMGRNGTVATVTTGGALLVAGVTLNASNQFIGLATVNVGSMPTVFQGGSPWTALATIVINPLNIVGAGATNGLFASTATGAQMNVGIMDRQGHTADIDISGAVRTFLASSATLYAVTTGGGTTTVFQGGAPWSVNVASIATLYAVTTGGAVNATVFQGGAPWTALATVVVANSMVTVTLGTKLDFGNDSITAVITSLPSVNGVVATSTKAQNISPFGIAGTNLSGSTIFVSSASRKFYITNLVLSNSSNVGVVFLNGATYLTGNASVRMQLPEKGGFVENGSPQSPLYFGLANQTNFLIVTDTAAPVSGRVTWFEE